MHVNSPGGLGDKRSGTEVSGILWALGLRETEHPASCHAQAMSWGHLVLGAFRLFS